MAKFKKKSTEEVEGSQDKADTKGTEAMHEKRSEKRKKKRKAGEEKSEKKVEAATHDNIAKKKESGQDTMILGGHGLQGGHAGRGR